MSRLHPRLLCAVAALALAAPCAAADEKTKEVKIAGRYACKGANPEGGAYEGKVEISKNGDTYTLKWTLGEGESYEGVGLLNGDALSVTWKAEGVSGLVVYKVAKGDKGPKLVGKWTPCPSDGKLFDETLTYEGARDE
jgi:hypothetical protein